MGRWAQSQRRGGVAPGATQGGVLAAPDPGFFEWSEFGDGSDTGVAMQNMVGLVPAGADGWIWHGGPVGDPHANDGVLHVGDLPSDELFVVLGGGGTQAFQWLCAWSLAGLAVSPFCPVQTFTP